MENKKVGVAAENPMVQELVVSALYQEGIPCACLNWDEKISFLRRLKEVSCVVVAYEKEEFLRKTINIVRSFGGKDVMLVCFGAGVDSDFSTEYGEIIEFIPYRLLLNQKEKKRFCQNLQMVMHGRMTGAKVQRNATEENGSSHFVAIGASTGGPGAVLSVLTKLPARTCGILLVQHLSRGFSSQFSAYLDQRCEMAVVEARSGERVKDGTVYVAPDEMHMTVRRSGGGFTIHCEAGPRVNGVCPSVDCLMESAASAAGKNAMGIILTGMGADGARGLLAMRNAGAYTVVQDQKTSLIYSMPHEAFLLGGARKQLPVEEIGAEIQKFCIEMNR